MTKNFKTASIMKKYTIFAAALLFHAASQAIIITGQKLYNTKTNQTIFLLGDQHTKVAQDKAQLQSVIQAIEKNNGTLLIEGQGPTPEPTDALKTLQEHEPKISFIDTEIRSALLEMYYLLKWSEADHRSLEQAKSAWLSDRYRTYIYNLFGQAIGKEVNSFVKKNKAFLDDCKQNEYSPTLLTAISEHIDTMQNLAEEVIQAAPEIIPERTQEEQSKVAFLVENILTEREGKLYLIADKISVFQKLFALNNIAFELNVAQQSISQKTTPLVIALMGEAHLAPVSTLLQAAGYSVIHEQHKDPELKLINEKLADLGEVAQKTSPELDKYAINLDTFLAK